MERAKSQMEIFTEMRSFQFRLCRRFQNLTRREQNWVGECKNKTYARETKVLVNRLPFNCRDCHCPFKTKKFGKWRYISSIKLMEENDVSVQIYSFLEETAVRITKNTAKMDKDVISVIS